MDITEAKMQEFQTVLLYRGLDCVVHGQYGEQPIGISDYIWQVRIKFQNQLEKNL